MADVDQALARAYARRGPSEPAGGSPPAPHFTVEPAAPADGPSAVLEWPATVRALERQHGDRFDPMAAELLRVGRERGLRSILFTSCHRAEGRTTLLLTLARSLARTGGRILLVDSDLSGPMLARSLGLRPRVGLDDVIEGGAAPADAILHAADDHLSVLPLRAPVARPREFLANPAWPTVMGRLRRDFDLILVDGSPLFAGLGAAILHRAVDAAILVHNRTLTGERAVRRAHQVLEAGGIPMLGLAETFV